jgi:PAS domain S-box-containing protein
VNPEGEFAYANTSFARRFGYAVEDLWGLAWDEVFTAAERDRLEAKAVPVVEKGWRWTGSCEGRRNDGERFTARTVIAGLEDGSTVFAVTGSE